MVSISLISYVSTVQDVDYSHITDLEIITVNGQDRLYSTTLYDGVIRSWTIGSGVSLQSTDVYSGGLRAGGTSTLATLDLGGGAVGLLTGGGANGALQIQTLQSGGGFGAPTTLGALSYSLGGLHHGTTVDLANGQQAVFGGMAGASGVAQIRFTSSGTYHSSTIISDTSTTFASDITGVQSATVGGNSYVFTSSGQENGVSSWLVGSSGGLTSVDNLGVDDLWTSAPSALEVATVGSETFLVLGAAGSNSLSILQVSPNGQLTIRDHTLDTLDSRFGGVSAIEVIAHNGQTFVVAGGADDGISVFQLLPGGQLVARGHLADTTGMSLANVSAITLRGNGNGIDIFVASSSENGITRLFVETGPAGVILDAATGGQNISGGSGSDVLSGLGGNDILRGQNGNDILRDGAGRDTMFGGGGADIFVLAYDGEDDVIGDFVAGEDRIDLSGWPMLRSVSQPTMSMTSTGMVIEYGDERLVIHSANGQPIDHRLLSTTDLIGGMRIPEVILPGYAGPNQPAPALPEVTTTPEVSSTGFGGVRGSNYVINFGTPQLGPFTGDFRDGSQVNNLLVTGGRNDRLFGRGGNDRIDAGGGSDSIYGGGGHDVILGRDGDDWVDGGDGNDLILTGGGNDVVRGWRGDDDINGGDGDDQIFGEAGDDRIQGYNGNDRLDGGDGNNRIYGQSGDDRIIAGSGRDSLYGGGGNDLIAGRTGNDRLEGGAGHDKLLGGDGDDVLTGQQGEDHLEGSYGDDFLFGGGENDFLAGQQGNDRIEGGTGADYIYGGGDNDILVGNQDNDFIHGGIGNDFLYGGSGRDTLNGFVGDDRLEGSYQNDVLIGGDGADILAGQQDHDWLDGGNGNDQLYGGSGHDTLFGQAGNDRLYGSDGNDQLFGGAGNDLLYGGAGRNTLDGGSGNDTLVGGNGPDQFVFSRGSDEVRNFEVNRDTLAIDSDLWAGTLAPSDLGFLYGSYSGGGVMLDFGGGNQLQINGITDLAALGDLITFV